MVLNLKPLIRNPQFRLLFIGQTVSFIGSMMTYVAIPYQVYQMTKDSFVVGLFSALQLVPLVLAGMYGGALADSVDRRKLLIWSEIALATCAAGLVFNSLSPQPSIVALAILSALSSAFVGIHRPAMDALLPQIVSRDEMTAAVSLGSMRYAIGAIAGPALAGVLIAEYGVPWTYVLDTMTFVVSVACLWMMKSVVIPDAKAKADLGSILEGLKYALSQPVIMGTYLVDIIAMVLAMPMALYPAIAEQLGQTSKIGWLYAAMPVGAGVLAFFSGWLHKLERQGAGVILSATAWGVFIVAMAFAPDLLWMSVCLALAGAADSISGIYRQTIWNEVIPANKRGRLGSLNMISYMIGPLLGNARAGAIAGVSSNHVSILSGGVLCVIGCISCVWIFPKFWAYRRP